MTDPWFDWLTTLSKVDGKSIVFFKVLGYWMPDQVRQDRHKLNAFFYYDTASDRVA
jgi:hypothetical protein